ncbi:hypothetical protein ABH892_004519 [Paenibacillus sp. RC254]
MTDIQTMTYGLYEALRFGILVHDDYTTGILSEQRVRKTKKKRSPPKRQALIYRYIEYKSVT